MEQTRTGFRAEIPPMRRPSAIVFSIVFVAFSSSIGLVFWRRAEGFGQLFSIGVVLLLATVGTLGLIQEVFGTETIELDSYQVRVWDRILGIGRARTFDITLMRNIRIGASAYWQGGTYVMSNGRIQFDYEGKMVSIGGNVNEDEAFRIVDAIRAQRTPENIGR